MFVFLLLEFFENFSICLSFEKSVYASFFGFLLLRIKVNNTDLWSRDFCENLRSGLIELLKNSELGLWIFFCVLCKFFGLSILNISHGLCTSVFPRLTVKQFTNWRRGCHKFRTIVGPSCKKSQQFIIFTSASSNFYNKIPQIFLMSCKIY